MKDDKQAPSTPPQAPAPPVPAKKMAWRATAKNYRVTTIRKKGADGKTQANIEIFANHILVIEDSEGQEEGKEFTNRERIAAMRQHVKTDRMHYCHEFDLDAEAEDLKSKTKKIASLTKERDALLKELEALRGKGAQVGRQG
jgi:hypothetical protein